MYSTLVTPWHREKKKKKKRTPTKDDTGKRKKKEVTLKDQTMYLFTNFTILISSFCMSSVAPISLFFFNIIIFTIFIAISFIAFYHWVMLEILQILLLMSYKLASHQLQKIISNIYSLYCLGNTNYIFTTSVCKICSSYDYELVIFVYLF